MYYDMKSVYDQLGFRVLPPAGVSPFGSVDAAADRCDALFEAGERSAELYVLPALGRTARRHRAGSQSDLERPLYLEPDHHEAPLHRAPPRRR